MRGYLHPIFVQQMYRKQGKVSHKTTLTMTSNKITDLMWSTEEIVKKLQNKEDRNLPSDLKILAELQTLVVQPIH